MLHNTFVTLPHTKSIVKNAYNILFVFVEKILLNILASKRIILTTNRLHPFRKAFVNNFINMLETHFSPKDG